MSWFDEQIKDRIRSDNEVFEESFIKAAGVVMGRKLSAALNDQRQAATDAIGEILKAFHIKAREVPDSITDMNETLEFLLRPHGIMRRNVTLGEHWYRDASGPMLGTRADDGTVVALIPSGLSHYSFFDTHTGKRVTINRHTENMIDREALAFYKPFPSTKIGVPGLIRYIIDNLRPTDIVMMLAATLVVSLLGLLLPKMNNLLFSVILNTGSSRALIGAGVFMVCLTVSTVIFSVIKELLTAHFSLRVSLSVEAAVMMRVLSLPATFFKDFSSGELANRAAYVSEIVKALLSTVFSTMLTSLFSLIYITQIGAYAPSLVIPAVVVIALTLVISLAAAFVQARITRTQLELDAKESGLSYALISGIQKIKLSGAEKRAFARWGDTYSKSAKLLYDPPMFLKIHSVIVSIVSLIGTIVIYYLAARNQVSVSEYYAFNAAYGMLSGAFVALAEVAVIGSTIKPMLDMTRPILDSVPEIAEEKQVVEKLMGGIELNNVTFTYKEGQPNVLDGVSLKIRPGQYVAIVGKTGCGKSTLMRVMLGFEKPQRGAVYYDGRDLERIDLKSLRRNIGTVIQEGKLFQGDIFSNIVITNPRLTLEDAWEAARMAGMAEDIERMPMGMFTIISEGQGGVSGGQRQRLLIARAIAPKPKILMFDEATSALDNITQKVVSDSLDNLKCTRIVIAHRLSTIKQCDRIIVLDKGKIIEDGTYDELIQNNGFFAELVERQRIDT